jgi:hypothetical protein
VIKVSGKPQQIKPEKLTNGSDLSGEKICVILPGEESLPAKGLN